MDAVIVCRAMLLGALYNLPQDQIEYQICDLLSFMWLLDLGLEERGGLRQDRLGLYCEGLQSGRSNNDHDFVEASPT